MKRNMDATFSADLYSARGLGGGLEYRYLLSQGVGGLLNLYYFNYKKGRGGDDPANAYVFRFKHNQTLPLNINLVADIDYSSSFSFLREFDNDFRWAVVSNRSSQVYLSKAWSYFNLNLRLARFETYFRESESSIITHNLPVIGFSSSKMKLFSPLYFSFSSSFKSWEYGWDYEYKEGRQRHSRDVVFIPQLTLPFTVLPWLTVNSSLSSNLSYSFQSYDPTTRQIVDEPFFRQNYAADVELVGPVFYKIYYGRQGEAKLKHIIEPSISYRYESPVDDPGRIITAQYFYRDHYLRYELANRFLVKADQTPREAFSLGLSQTFYFSPEDSPLNIFRVDGKIPEFSDISGYIRFYPAGKYSLDVKAAYNPSHNKFSMLRLGAGMGSPQDSAFLRVNWYKSINPYQYETWWDRHQIGFFGGVKIPRLSLELQADADFNISLGKMLYAGLAFIYHYQCIDFRGELKIFYFRDRPETQFRISFELGNIGRTSDILGGMGF